MLKLFSKVIFGMRRLESSIFVEDANAPGKEQSIYIPPGGRDGVRTKIRWNLECSFVCKCKGKEKLGESKSLCFKRWFRYRTVRSADFLSPAYVTASNLA